MIFFARPKYGALNRPRVVRQISALVVLVQSLCCSWFVEGATYVSQQQKVRRVVWYDMSLKGECGCGLEGLKVVESENSYAPVVRG
jgi:hypothetical protein